MANPEIRQIEHNSPEYWEMVELRDRVLRRPIGLELDRSGLMEEDYEFHIAVFLDEVPVGGLILRPLSEIRLKMRAVAIDDGYRDLGLGSKLVNFAEEFARERGFNEMELNAREPAFRFYEKLGYEKISADFIEVGIPHALWLKHL